MSQVLPVLAQGSYAEDGAVLLSEQPEIHLHTIAAKKLVKVFIDTCREKNAKIIAETHSPHIIHQVQQELRSGSLKPSEVVVYRVIREGGAASIKELRIEDDFSIYDAWEKVLRRSNGECQQMLKRDKNILYEAIIGERFRPEDFDVREDVPKKGMFSLKLRGTPFAFFVRSSPTSYSEFDCSYVLLAPEFPVGEWVPGAGYASIDYIAATLREWLIRNVRPYLDEEVTPDLWEEAKGQADFVRANLDSPGAREKFSEGEKQQILVSIEQVRLLIKEEFAPNEAELARVGLRLDYLGKAVDRLNRFDWKGVLLNTIIGISTALTLDTTRGAELLQLFKRAFSGVVQLLR